MGGRFAKVCPLLSLIATSLFAMDDNPSRIDAFLDRHWQFPLAPQGAPAEAFTTLESALHAQVCGHCHPQQLADWRGSLHAHAMGPGLLGQLLMMDGGNREGHQACLRCHAPLAEQADELAAVIVAGERSFTGITDRSNPDGPLYAEGLMCAACHLRQRVVYGPPARNVKGRELELPHNGFVEETAFEASAFCAVCHQFARDGYALNGKLLQNTVEEWRESPQAKQGRSCQSCHMPDRRHLWRGIHDREMVLSGIRIELDLQEILDGRVTGILRLANSDTGHRLPTYVTPRIVLMAVQLDRSGEPIDQTRQEWTIARQVSLDLSVEQFDTRLAPGERAELNYSENIAPDSAALLFEIIVEPDRFYRDFYRSIEESDSHSMAGEQLHRARRAAEHSHYSLFRRLVPLDSERR